MAKNTGCCPSSHASKLACSGMQVHASSQEEGPAGALHHSSQEETKPNKAEQHGHLIPTESGPQYLGHPALTPSAPHAPSCIHISFSLLSLVRQPPQQHLRTLWGTMGITKTPLTWPP